MEYSFSLTTKIQRSNASPKALRYKNNLSSVGGKLRPGIVHRLDKFTSGLIVIAKNNTTHLALSEQFKMHSILRKYKALVWGTPKNQIIKGFIERHKIY